MTNNNRFSPPHLHVFPLIVPVLCPLSLWDVGNMGNVGNVGFDRLDVHWFGLWTPMTRMLSFMSSPTTALSTLHGVVGGKGGEHYDLRSPKMEVKK